MLELAAAQNMEGYHHALLKSWSACEDSPEEAPAKSSLSEMRGKVSYHFFEEIFRSDLERQKHKKWRGLRVYAIDGDQLDLPASQDVLAHGFRGYPTKRQQETHYPKLYSTFAYDILNEQVTDFAFSSQQDEVHLARAMVPSFGSNSLCIYDRLHSGYWSMQAHFNAENYFLIRARTTQTGTNDNVREFLASTKKEAEITWRPLPGLRREQPDLHLRAVKLKNPKTKRVCVFLTNLPKQFSSSVIAQLYRRRWEIETEFRDLTTTLKMGQLHSKSINGILQEIYALLWLVNATKRQMLAAIRKHLMQAEYSKANFKLAIRFVIDNFGLLVRRKLRRFFNLLNHLLRRTLEKRCRDSRSYPRVVKHRGREYPPANVIKRRAKPLTERH